MLSEIMLGQFVPGNSFVHNLDPRTKLLGTILFIVALFMARSAVGYGIVTGFALLAVLLSRLPLGLIGRALKPVWFIVVITFVIHALTFPGTEVVWHWKFFTVTREGLTMGGQIALRLALLLLVSSVLTFTTSPIVLTDGIEKLLNPFRCIGVPAHELAMMMTIALRFIPTLLEETDRIFKAQEARGADFGNGGLLARMKNTLPLLVPLFVSAFRRADDLAVAMEARCYRGGEGRTRMVELAYRSSDFLAYAVLLSLVAGMAYLRYFC